MDKKIGILGYGEVGQAIAKIYDFKNLSRTKIKDLKRNDNLVGVEILNICIPWSDNFLKIVKKEIKEISPKLVIIHSTIAPGTTKKLSLNFPNISIAHSPVRGVHPYLYRGVKTFVKYIGAENKKSGKLAESHLKKLGIKTKLFIPSVNTELGKLLDTTYYGVCIAWHGEWLNFAKNWALILKKPLPILTEATMKVIRSLAKLTLSGPFFTLLKKG